MIIYQFIIIANIIVLAACLISIGVASLLFRDKKQKEVYCKLEVYKYEQVLELQKWLVNHIREKSTLYTYLHIFLDYTKNIDYPIATTEELSLEQIKYLKWHCPIKFVRECLVKYCGIKDHWYYRLGFRY